MGLQHALAMVGGIVTPPLIIGYLQDDPKVANCELLLAVGMLLLVSISQQRSVEQIGETSATQSSVLATADLVASSLIVSGICTCVHVSNDLASSARVNCLHLHV